MKYSIYSNNQAISLSDFFNQLRSETGLEDMPNQIIKGTVEFAINFHCIVLCNAPKFYRTSQRLVEGEMTMNMVARCILANLDMCLLEGEQYQVEDYIVKIVNFFQNHNKDYVLRYW